MSTMREPCFKELCQYSYPVVSTLQYRLLLGLVDLLNNSRFRATEFVWMNSECVFLHTAQWKAATWWCPSWVNMNSCNLRCSSMGLGPNCYQIWNKTC